MADLEGYEIVDGIIRSPGKFEGEPAYTLHFYDASMEGCDEPLFDMERHGFFGTLIEIDAEDRELFPNDIEPQHAYAYLTESDQGFASVELLTEAEADTLRAEAEDMDEEE